MLKVSTIKFILLNLVLFLPFELFSQNNALDFDGLNDIVITNPVTHGSNFTYEAWVKLNDLSPEWSGIIANRNTDLIGSSVALGLSASGSLKLEIIESFPGNFGNFDAVTNVNDNTWHHVAVTYDGINARFYVDGALDATWNFPATLSISRPLHIMTERVPTQWNRGSIDEVRIWNVTKTQLEIQNNRNNELIGNEANLLAYYNFNQGIANGSNAAVTTLNDLTANNVDGTLSNFSLSGANSNWVSGAPVIRMGASLKFDGVNDYVKMPLADLAPLSSGTEITIEYWFKGTTNQSAVRMQPFSNGYWIIAGWNNAGTLKHVLSFDGGTNGLLVSPANQVTDGNWHHVAMTWKSNTVNGFKSYFDGILVEQRNSANAILPNISFDENYIGSHLTSSEFLNGSLDEVRIWNVARTCEELNYTKNCQLTGSESGLVIYYDFNQGIDNTNNSAVTTLIDKTPSSTSAILNNFSLTGVTSNWSGDFGVAPNINCIVGPPTAPNISVEGNSTTIASGDATPSLTDYTDFGNVDISGAPFTRTFTIRNLGTGTLNIFGTTRVSVSGVGFTLLTDAAATVSAGGFTTFQINFDPIGAGPSTGIVTINSNDCGDNSYTFSIRGNGTIAGAALNFDGANDRVDLGTDNAFNLQNNFTIEAWVKGSNYLTKRRIISRYDGSSSGWAFGVDAGGLLGFTNYNVNDYSASSNAVANSVWTHVAFVVSNNIGTFYVNGNVSGTTTAMALPNISGVNTFLGFSNYSPEPFLGDIDEVRIWNRALCQSEIINNMSCEIPTSAPDLLANYHFNQGNGGDSNPTETILLDASGNNKNGILTNFGLLTSTSNWVAQTPGGVTSGNSCTPIDLPVISVLGNLVTIQKNDFAPSSQDFTDFGSSITSRIFTIRNLSATATLTISSAILTGLNSSEFSITSPSPTLSPGGSTTFTVTYLNTSPGIRTATVNITSNDCFNPTYSFNVQAGARQLFISLPSISSVATSTIPGGLSCPTFQSGTGYTQFLDIDQQNSKIYFSTFTDYTIGVMDLDGSNKNNALISTGTNRASGVAVNSIEGKLYFAEEAIGGGIRKANLDGTGVTTVLNVDRVMDIAIDPYNEKIYYTRDGGIMSIGVVNMDGSGHNPNFVTGANFPYGLGIDLNNSKVYWTNLGNGSIGRANLDGTSVNQAFISIGGAIHDVLIDNDLGKIYWTNRVPGSLGSANIDGTGVNTSFVSGLTDAVGLAIGGILTKDISVRGNSVEILYQATSPSSSDHTYFGSVELGNSFQRTYTIQNTGNAVLSISSITVTGTASSDFIVGTYPSTVAAGSSATFAVTFTPTVANTRNAVITVLNNDCDEDNYFYSIEGDGTSPPIADNLDFDGVNDYLETGFVPSAAVMRNFTLECWVKGDAAPQTGVNIYNGPIYGFKLGIVWDHQNGGAYRSATVYDASGTPHFASFGTISGNIWYHLAATYDGQTLRSYKDGVLITSTPTGGGFSDDPNTLKLGTHPNTSLPFPHNFAGQIDEVRVWSRVLSGAEIAANMNCQLSGQQQCLELYYQFNQGFPNIDNTLVTFAADSSGKARNATFNGFALSGGANSNFTSGTPVTGSCTPAVIPEINVKRGTANILSASSYDFGSVVSGGAGTPVSFQIENLATATLMLTGSPNLISISGANPAEFELNQTSTNNMVLNGSPTSFTVTFKPTTPGVKSAVITIPNEDCDESPYIINFTGTSLAPPDINVSQSGIQVTSIAPYSFGSINKFNSSAPIVFTIENTSPDGSLSLTGLPQKIVKLLTTPSQDFIITQTSLPSTLAPSTTTTFTITFTPSQSGTRRDTISIASSDPDENPYKFVVTGFGLIAGDINTNASIGSGEVAGDVNNSGSINGSELCGDVSGDFIITPGKEILGDANGNGIIDNGEKAGDRNGDGTIINPEIAGDANGNGVIDGTEFTGDINGNGILDTGEVVGDADGNGSITPPEVAGDVDGNGQVEPIPSYVMTGKGTILTNYLSRYIIEPPLPPYFTYRWVYSDESLFMIKDTTRAFMDVVANNQTNSGTLYCYIYQFGLPYDTLEFPITINKTYVNLSELAELSEACAEVANPANDCQESFIDYFKLNTINYEKNGCVRGGYQDLTATGFTTDLEMGFTYTVELKPNKLFLSPNGVDTASLFYAIWLDYNNDGDFEDFAEYVKNGESNTSSVKLINITIANNEQYKGSRRLRVGMRSGGGFEANDACGLNAISSSGELEDYLVTLVPMGELQAPNYLTPNNDGDNDIFSIKGVNMEKIRTLTIVNKAGTIVYQEENYGDNELWGGKASDGKLLPKGTYYYIFKNGTSELKSFLEIEY